MLAVAVQAPAVDGRATQALVDAVAEAFGVRGRDVEVVTGATSRTKTLRVAGHLDRLQSRLTELLGPPWPPILSPPVRRGRLSTPPPVPYPARTVDARRPRVGEAPNG